MNKQTKINLGLLVAIAMIASFLMLTGRDKTPNEPAMITNIPKENIEIITLKREGQNNIIFTKHQDIWQMTSPKTATANITRINAMLYILQARSYAQLYAKGPSLRRFDLQNPAVTLQLNEHEFFFGGTNPLEHRRYLQFEDTVHLINDSLFHQLQQPPDFFIQAQDE